MSFSKSLISTKAARVLAVGLATAVHQAVVDATAGLKVCNAAAHKIEPLYDDDDEVGPIEPTVS